MVVDGYDELQQMADAVLRLQVRVEQLERDLRKTERLLLYRIDHLAAYGRGPQEAVVPLADTRWMGRPH